MSSFNHCIYCEKPVTDDSREHIISAFLGGDEVRFNGHQLPDPLLPAGWVCDKCNSVFSKFETKMKEDAIIQQGIVIHQTACLGIELPSVRNSYLRLNSKGGLDVKMPEGKWHIEKVAGLLSRWLVKCCVNIGALQFGPEWVIRSWKPLRLHVRSPCTSDQAWPFIFTTEIGVSTPSINYLDVIGCKFYSFELPIGLFYVPLEFDKLTDKQVTECQKILADRVSELEQRLNPNSSKPSDRIQPPIRLSGGPHYKGLVSLFKKCGLQLVFNERT